LTKDVEEQKPHNGCTNGRTNRRLKSLYRFSGLNFHSFVNCWFFIFNAFLHLGRSLRVNNSSQFFLGAFLCGLSNEIGDIVCPEFGVNSLLNFRANIGKLSTYRRTSVVRSEAANGGQVKSGQRISMKSGVLLDVFGCP